MLGRNLNVKKIVNKKEQELLKKNPSVKSVSDKAITYKNEFKRHFIAKNENGKLPRDFVKFMRIYNVKQKEVPKRCFGHF